MRWFLSEFDVNVDDNCLTVSLLYASCVRDVFEFWLDCRYTTGGTLFRSTVSMVSGYVI
jgi:hypothetical protein